MVAGSIVGCAEKSKSGPTKSTDGSTRDQYGHQDPIQVTTSSSHSSEPPMLGMDETTRIDDSVIVKLTSFTKVPEVVFESGSHLAQEETEVGVLAWVSAEKVSGGTGTFSNPGSFYLKSGEVTRQNEMTSSSQNREQLSGPVGGRVYTGSLRDSSRQLAIGWLAFVVPEDIAY